MTVTNWNILFGIFYFSDWYWQTCGDCYHRKNQRKLSYLHVSFNTKYLKNLNIILLSFQNHRRGRSEWGWGMWANTRENMDHWSHRRHNQLHPQKSTHLHHTRTGCPEGYQAFLHQHFLIYEIKLQEIVFGIVFNPVTEELWTARKGKGAFYNGRKVGWVENYYFKLIRIYF